MIDDELDEIEAVMDDGRRDHDAGSVVSGTQLFGLSQRWNHEK